MQADSLSAEPPKKPKNTGVGSLSLSPGDLPDPGLKLGSPALQVDSLLAELSGKPVSNERRNINPSKGIDCGRGSCFRDSVQGKSRSAKVTFVQRPGQSEQLDRGTFHAVGTARTKVLW